MKIGCGNSGRLPKDSVPLIRHIEIDTILWSVLFDDVLVKDDHHFHILFDGQDLLHGIAIFFIVNIVEIVKIFIFGQYTQVSADVHAGNSYGYTATADHINMEDNVIMLTYRNQSQTSLAYQTSIDQIKQGLDL